MSIKIESKRQTPGDYRVTVYQPASPGNGLRFRRVIAVYRVIEYVTGDWEITHDGEHKGYFGTKRGAQERIAEWHGVK